MNFRKNIEDSIKNFEKLFILEKNINNSIKLIYTTLKNRNNLFLCGNGGSAAQAQHLAAEYLVRLRPEINRKPYAAISLAQDTSTLTACGNDFGFKYIFSRNLEALGKKKDLLLVFSTSGKSENIIEVLKTSKKLGINSISFLGNNNGGLAKGIADIDIIVNCNSTARIQEMQLFLSHFIFIEVENLLVKKKK
jgi:D-sedoheptulose 7-phosphate isomerase